MERGTSLSPSGKGMWYYHAHTLGKIVWNSLQLGHFFSFLEEKGWSGFCFFSSKDCLHSFRSGPLFAPLGLLLSVLSSWNKRRYPAVERPQQQADDAFNKKIMFINWILVTKECGDAEPCPVVCLLLKSCEYITLRLGKLRGVKTSKSFSSSTLQWHFCQLQRTMQIWTIMNIVLILLSVAWGSFESTCRYTGKFISTHPDCMVLKSKLREFPVLGTLCSHCQGPGFNPWSGN